MPTPHPTRLTPAQRLHLDVYGFVLLENVLTPDEVARMKDALYRLKAEPDLVAHGVYVNSRSASFLSIAQAGQAKGTDCSFRGAAGRVEVFGHACLGPDPALRE